MLEPVTLLGIAAVLACTVGCVVLTGLYLRQRATIVQLRGEIADQHKHLLGLERDLAALLSCSRRIGDRIGDGERSWRTLQKQLDRLQHSGDDQLAVEHAMKLLNNGLAMKEITEICDLTAGEVEILQNLSRHRQAA